MAAWKGAWFSPAQLADGTSDDAFDPQGDGYANLLKYAFGLGPFDQPFTLQPQAVLEGGHLTLSYQRLTAVSDLSYLAEVADALGGPWLTGPEYIEQVSVTNNDDSTSTIKVRDREAVADHLQRFLRLRVTRTTRDTDGDGLDDDAELRYFGNLLQTPAGDFDGDGISNLDELLNHTNPADYYNGLTPQLEIVSGDLQTAEPDGRFTQPLRVRVSRAADPSQMLANAPVTFALRAGAGVLLPGSSIRTGADGIAEAHFETTSAFGAALEIAATAAPVGATSASVSYSLRAST